MPANLDDRTDRPMHFVLATFNSDKLRELIGLARVGIRRVTAAQRRLIGGSGLLAG